MTLANQWRNLAGCAPAKGVLKHEVVLNLLEENILSSKFAAGKRLPSETTLTRQLKVSRITVGRAIRELVNKGLVERRIGSGTYVRAENRPGLVFGVLIPGSGETEIFEPICRGMLQLRRPCRMLCCGGTPRLVLLQRTNKHGNCASGSSREK